jgi:hypothetical protein
MAILSPLLLWVALLIGALCGFWMMVLGFKRHLAWGIALFLPQVALGLSIFAFFQGTEPAEPAYVSLTLVGAVIYLCFLVVAWPDTKQPFFWWLTSVLLMVLFFVAVFQSNEPMSPLAARVLRARAVTQVQFEHFENTRFSMSRPDRTRPDTGPAAPGQRTSRTQTRPPVPVATPAPVFRSRLPPPPVVPGQREQAQPGIYYLLERVTTRTAKGVQNGLPGEKVILLERLPGSKMRVTVGDADFVVHSSQVTDDVSVARELEKQDFTVHGGQL